MRKLVTIRKVKDVLPIKNADFIELAIVDGWQCIIKKGELKKGEYCVYFEIDSLIPIEDENFSFINNEKTFKEKRWKYIKTIKLRKILSQGLAIPIEKASKIKELVGEHPENFMETDFSDVLGVAKYEEEVNFREAIGSFPYYVKKTGENRIQNIFDNYKEKYKNIEFVPTLKMDGSSLTIAYVNNKGYILKDEEADDQVWVSSHNLVLKKPEEGQRNPFFSAIEAINLEEKLLEWGRKNNKQIAIQGELLGPKIQGNYEKFEQFTFRVFYIFFIDEQRRSTTEEMNEICEELGIKTVIEYEPIKVFEKFNDVNDLLKFAEGESENGVEREGLVFKSKDLIDGEVITFKVISNKYLLGKK